MNDQHKRKRIMTGGRIVAVAAAISLAGLLGPAVASAQTVGGLCNPSTPSVSAGDDFVYEHESAQVKITLSAKACTTVRVDYYTINGSAQAGVDYVAASGTVNFPPGTTVRYVTILIVDDALYEYNETFYVRLTNPVGASLGDSIGKVTISGLEPAG